MSRRKQKKKAGRVVRVTPDIAKRIAEEQKDGETIPVVLRRLLNLTGPFEYVLPSDLYSKLSQARGAALLKAVRDRGKPEAPVRVKRE